MEKIKELALSEFIRKCIDNGELEQKMDQIQQKAAELEVPENELQVLVDQVVKSSAKADVVVKMAKKNKTVIVAVTIVLVLIEWFLIFNPSPAEGESTHVLLTIIVNIITIAAVIIGYSAIALKKINK